MKRILIILILAAGIGLAGFIVYILFFHNFSAAPQTSVNLTEEEKSKAAAGEENSGKTNTSASEANKAVKKEVTRDDLARMAASFAERFGSYSNHSDYGNIVDLQIFMSRKMQEWSDNFIAEARSKSGGEEIYYGITTKALTTEVAQYDEAGGLAKVLVKTQRRESFGATSNASVSYQDINLNFIKESGAWKVDQAEWQKK